MERVSVKTCGMGDCVASDTGTGEVSGNGARYDELEYRVTLLDLRWSTKGRQRRPEVGQEIGPLP